MRGDWVYRPNMPRIDSEFGEDLGGTYGNEVILAAGEANLIALNLFDSRRKSVDLQIDTDGSLGVGVMPSSAKPEGGRGPLIMGVRGWVAFRPSMWSISGQRYSLCLRIGVFEQDYLDGLPFIHSNYTLWSNVSLIDPPATFANERKGNLWELRSFSAYGESARPWASWYVNARFKTRLTQSEGLFLLAGTSSDSQSGTLQSWLKSYVVDDLQG